MERRQRVIILTDYWNGVRKIRRILEEGQTVGGAGKGWYRWILRLMDSLISENVVIEIRHVKAHTDEDTEDANLNRKADEAARNPKEPCLNWAPIPTFEMDDFVAQSEHGNIDKDIYAWALVKKKQIRAREAKQRYPRLNESIYERTATLCTKYYNKSRSDYAIKVQAMIRSNALPTYDRLSRTFGDDAQDCPCGHPETDHHIFVKCKLHKKEIDTAIQETANKLTRILQSYHNPTDSDIESPTESDINSSLQAEFRSLFEDSEMWPGGMSRWYYGHVPRLATPLREMEKRRGLQEIHFQLVRLAGFIWLMRAKGKYQSGVTAIQEHNRRLEELATGRTASLSREDD
jgi:hypothetical protein